MYLKSPDFAASKFDKYVSLPNKAEAEVICGGKEGTEDHGVDGQLDRDGGLGLEGEVLSGHGHEDGHPPEGGQHGQGELLGATQAKEHVAKVKKRQGPHLGNYY